MIRELGRRESAFVYTLFHLYIYMHWINLGPSGNIPTDNPVPFFLSSFFCFSFHINTQGKRGERHGLSHFLESKTIRYHDCHTHECYIRTSHGGSFIDFCSKLTYSKKPE